MIDFVKLVFRHEHEPLWVFPKSINDLFEINGLSALTNVLAATNGINDLIKYGL